MEQSNTCKRCGQCCCNILIYKHEAKQIKEYLSKNPEVMRSLVRPFNHQGCIFLLDNADGTSRCAIYDSGVRPTVCKVFGTKGLYKLKCPNNCYSKYTLKQANQMVEKANRKSKIAGYMNEIMLPFIKDSVKKLILEQISAQD